MAILLNAHRMRKAFGARPLFEGLSFSINSGERIGLIGPNGAGKSTLLSILAGRASPDEGTLTVARGTRVALLEQVPQFDEDSTVMETILEGGGEISRAQELLSRLSLNDAVQPDSKIATLSGGWKKRVALARELMREPDVLLLDEPTNHLDVESILWLEQFLARAPFATLTITHDRVFLQRVSTRILELDRRNVNGLLSVEGDYAKYLDIKSQMLEAQASSEIRLKNRLRRETEWLRQGAKARTTKQQARIKRAHELADTVGELEYRNQNRTADLSFETTDRAPKKLLEAKAASKRYGDRLVVPPLDLTLRAGSRIGILGPNGCGKSTLIKLLLGEETPSSGEVVRSDLLQVAYFEQNRDRLDPEVSLLKTLCPTGDHVDFRGTRIHVRGYLDRFLFGPSQMEMAVGKLSGGEQARVCLAQLMLAKANLLVLDEPTNDLDMATLDVLEDVLGDFPGAILLVTHDRYFLDQVSETILAFGPGPAIESFQGVDQWEKWRASTASAKTPKAAATGKSSGSTKRKLGYMEQREFDGMEKAIEIAEARVAELTEESAKPEHASNASTLARLGAELAAAQEEVDRLYARWGELGG